MYTSVYINYICKYLKIYFFHLCYVYKPIQQRYE